MGYEWLFLVLRVEFAFSSKQFGPVAQW
ncbi:hypothetical protein EYZ11_008753 [Aspergillus tanneri]|uniref:Uncharacterized protein n=1 Tax=Aspergillus tanneri TaxID=1220188 RepID=A0A4S3JA20_9EURO|nr:hypothetical protein EYZ11_008753 [Aspergillus tanneri]